MSKKKEHKEEAQQEKQTEATAEEVTEDSQEVAQEKKDSQLEGLQKELESKQSAYMRLAAEYDNYRKRTTSEKASIYGDATAKAVNEILPVADSLEMALKSAENAPDEYKKGLELVCGQLLSALKKLNVEPFGEIGDEFNPELHNAVSKIDSEDLGENTLSMIFQKGYKTGDKIIRHAMVQVANCD
ncbi:MAG TPA: nucleotide exchange factor GrpE [Clostridiales bacterium]|nr:nucleotide exchange factor GrpE [Clostridiales bacterium]